MKRAMLSLFVAAAIAIGGFAIAEKSPPTTEAASTYYQSQCWYDQFCQLTWYSGYGAYKQTWYGVTTWGAGVQQVNYAPFCYATSCYRTSLKYPDPNIRWTGVQIEGFGFVRVAWAYCYSSPGGY